MGNIKEQKGKNFESLLELLEFFKDEKTCIEYYQQKRWGNNPVCPHCNNSKKIYKFSDGKRFKCAKCRSQFTVRVGTIFEDSKVPLKKWFIAAYLIINHKKGISSHQLGRDIKVTQKTAWFILHRIRTALDNGGFEITGKEVIEIDETFVGGKNKNRHKDKKVKNSQGRSYKDKTPILGMLERGGNVKVKKIKNTKRRIIQPIIEKTIPLGSNIVTDEWWAYRRLYEKYGHEFVNHAIKQYVNGEAHTNNIECFWSLFKRSIIGIYHNVTYKHLEGYADESAFRYNTRKINGEQRVSLFFKNTANMGKLSYKNLVENGDNR